jgi:hypothetical protein
MVEYLYQRIGKGILPDLIISVSRGEQDLKISKPIINAFKRGIVKSAKNANVWIITGGINMGASSLVGEAFRDAQITDQVIIGIASWGRILSRANLVVS